MQNIYNKFEKQFINQGSIITDVENKKSLQYINYLIKKNLVKILRLNVKAQKLNLNKIHNYINKININQTRLELIYKINKDKKFREVFYSLSKNMLNHIIGNELAMQNNINLSIQIPNDETSLLPIHSDTWSGDSPFESVLWLPLVDCYKTKSMFILKAKKIKKFNQFFSSKKIKSISDLYDFFKKDIKFLEIEFGKYLLFNQNLPHGNLVNKTSETRVSLNCRFKGLFTPYSQKDLGSFFSPLKLRAATKLGLEYKLPGDK